MLNSAQNGSADTSNFDEEFTREQPTLTPVHGQLSSRDQQEFAGFSWVSYMVDHTTAYLEVDDIRPGGCLGRCITDLFVKRHFISSLVLLQLIHTHALFSSTACTWIVSQTISCRR